MASAPTLNLPNSHGASSLSSIEKGYGPIPSGAVAINVAPRKNRKASRKNRKASRKNRKASRKNRKASRKH